MRPKAIILFEQMILAAILIDLVNNFTSWSALSAGLAARGIAPSPVILLVSCLLSPAIGLLLWYFVARRASVVAKWVITVLVGLGVLAVLFSLRHGLPTTRSTFLLGVATEVVKVFAVVQLFKPEAKRWLGET